MPWHPDNLIEGRRYKVTVRSKGTDFTVYGVFDGMSVEDGELWLEFHLLTTSREWRRSYGSISEVEEMG